jgi:hypothetical protein
VPLVKEAFAAMDELYKNQDYKTLSSKFKLCNPIADAAGYNHLLLWLRNAFTIMAMVGFKFDAFKNNSFNKLACLNYFRLITRILHLFWAHCQDGLYMLLVSS